MKQGTVKFFNTEKNYGFISYDGGKEIFVHISGVTGQVPKEGDEVEFEVGPGKKGPQAINVTVI